MIEPFRGIRTGGFTFLHIAFVIAAGCCKAQPYNITTVAGTYTGREIREVLGDGDLATRAALYGPGGLAMDIGGSLYIADQGNNRIRKVFPNGVITTLAGSGKAFSNCLEGGDYQGDGGPAIKATLNCPAGVAVDSFGIVYIADTGNNVIRKVAQDGTISTFAGTGRAGYSGDGRSATGATLSMPSSLAIGGDGSVYFADFGNEVIRKISTDGIMSTVAGNGVRSDSGDGGPATSAGICCPGGIAVDAAGKIYIADGNDKIRVVSLNGTISTIAGVDYQFSGDGGPATGASFQNAAAVAVDSAGNLFIADLNSNRVRKVGTDGIINTIAGNGNFFYAGDGGPATTAGLQAPSALLAVGDRVYVSDVGHNLVRLLTPTSVGTAPTISPGGVVTLFSRSSVIQPGSWVSIYGNNLIDGSTPANWRGDYPTTLGGTRVTINNKPAYLSYASPTLINLQTPDDDARGPVNVTVTNAIGSSTATITLADQGPSFSLLGDGQHVAGIIFRPDGSGAVGTGRNSYDILGPPANLLGYKTVAAGAGDTVALFGVGFGPTSPTVPAGRIYTGSPAQANGAIKVTIGEKSVTPSFAGMISPGLFQFNLTIPSGLGSGELPLVAEINGVSTPSRIVFALR